MKVEARFLSKVDRSGKCWLWMGTKHKNGYGEFWIAPGGTVERFDVSVRGIGTPPGNLHVENAVSASGALEAFKVQSDALLARAKGGK